MLFRGGRGGRRGGLRGGGELNEPEVALGGELVRSATTANPATRRCVRLAHPRERVPHTARRGDGSARPANRSPGAHAAPPVRARWSARRCRTPRSPPAAPQRHQAVVLGLAVAAELQPAAEPRMQGQQRVAAIVVEHQGRRGEVAGHALRADMRRRAHRGKPAARDASSPARDRRGRHRAPTCSRSPTACRLTCAPADRRWAPGRGARRARAG